jgi:hypothetical protein
MSGWRLLALGTLVVMLGCGPAKPHRDARTRGILAGATRVEVFRIDGRNDPPDPTPIRPGDPTIGGYAIMGRGKDLGPEFARRLADVLLDDATYTDSQLACYWPGVAFRVHRGEEFVDVIICFKCGNLYVGPPTDRKGLKVESFHRSPADRRLIELAKEALPDDREVQAIGDEYHP